MRDSRGPTAGPASVSPSTSEHPELSVRFEALTSDLRSAIRHEIRGYLGALSLQLEIARRARSRDDDERVGGAFDSLGEDLETLSYWNEMSERWLSGTSARLETIGTSSSGELARDLASLLRVVGKRRRVTVEVEPLDSPESDQTVEPVARASALCFCLELLNQLSASSEAGRRRVLTIGAAAGEDSAGGLRLSWSGGSDQPSLRDWLALQKTALPMVDVHLEDDAASLRWSPSRDS